MRSLQFGELAVLAGVVGKLVVGEHDAGGDVRSHWESLRRFDAGSEVSMRVVCNSEITYKSRKHGYRRSPILGGGLYRFVELTGTYALWPVLRGRHYPDSRIGFHSLPNFISHPLQCLEIGSVKQAL